MKVVIAMTSKPFAQEIRIDDIGPYVNIGQDHDMICISRDQFDVFMSAMHEVSEAKGWLAT